MRVNAIPILLKYLFIAVPVGMLLSRNTMFFSISENPIFAIGVVWLFCLGIMARQKFIKWLFIAVPIGLLLTMLAYPPYRGIEGHDFIMTSSSGVVWLAFTGIIGLVCMGIMWLVNKFAKKSMPGNLGTETANKKLCPYCAEEIKVAASLCKHCGSSLDTPIQTKDIFACILLAIFVSCFYTDKNFEDVSGSASSISS